MATPPPFELSDTQSIPAAASPEMDPRLQWWVVCRQAGAVRAATSSTSRNEIAVIARVTDAEKWAALSEVRTPTTIGATPEGSIDNSTIVTGRIPISRIEDVRGQPFVKSLKASQNLRPQLDQTLQETEASPEQLPATHMADGGKGVVVGVIDYGGDFAHENFRRDDGSTRLLALWNQDAPSGPSSPFGYGRQYEPTDINLALQKPDPYAALKYDPADYEDPNDPGAHGTHVMDIAAGNGRGTSVPGMAPNAELVFVNISHAADPTGANVVGRSFGDSVRLLEAAKYIFDRAADRPCVINVSLGTNGGPHDGTTLVEQGLDSLVAAKPNRAVVLAAGNAFDDGIHAAGSIPAGNFVDLRWQVIASPQRNIEMEVWYRGVDRVTVELLDPAGVVRASVPPGQNKTLSVGNRVVLVANRLNDPNNGDNMIGVFLASGITPGVYTVRLRGDSISDGGFHAWIERDNSFASRFVPPHDNSHTIGTVSCGRLCLAVGSYDAHKAARPLSFFSSAGPTRDKREKPEVSAPGHNVRAALSSSRNGSRLMSGTSMAAPAVTGMIALMYSEALQRNANLSINAVRDVLIKVARKNPPPGNAWHPQFGHGRVHVSEAVREVITLAQNGSPGGSPSAGAMSAGLAAAGPQALNTPPKRRKRAAKGT